MFNDKNLETFVKRVIFIVVGIALTTFLVGLVLGFLLF